MRKNNKQENYTQLANVTEWQAQRLKIFFDKTPFLLNDMAKKSGEVKQKPAFRGNKFTKPKKKRK